MYLVGNIANARMAQAFVDYMMGLSVHCHIEIEPDTVSIWVNNSEQRQIAIDEFSLFLNYPNDPKYLAASWSNPNQQIIIKQKDANFSLFVDFISHTGPVTLSIFIACVLSYLTFSLGMTSLYEGLSFFPHFEVEHMGQFWRIFTPVLLHFSLVHILVNLLWWWYLGGKIEQQLSPSKLLLLFILGSSLPNIAQYYFSGPAFGGLAGVVYALIGYCWLSTWLNPKAELNLPSGYVIFMLAWFLLGFIEPLGFSVANATHVAGLAVGCIQAWLDRDKQRHQVSNE